MGHAGNSAQDGRRDRFERIRSLLELGELAEARELCAAQLLEDPDDAPVLSLLGQIRLAQNEDAAAIADFRAAVALAPDDADLMHDLALGLSQVGDLDGSEMLLRRVIELRPHALATHYFLAQMKRFTPGDPDLEALERIAAAESSLSDGQLMNLGFALAKALDDVGDYERAFRWLCRANALKRASLSYEPQVDLDFMTRVADVFDAELMARMSGYGSSSPLPLLVVGMPRSGTTLVEQILASHPMVAAGGERSDLPRVASALALLTDSGGAFPDGMRELAPQFLSNLGAGYCSRLAPVAPDAARITDKNVFNTGYLGLAALIAPQGRVVHCVRDPLDVCVSAFSLDFSRVRFSFDLQELGRFYHGYAELMAHWRRVLPARYMLEVSYEELVDDLEGVARRIVDHCGLPWDERCLRFHEAKRAVRTASFAQVRRPISRASIGRWRRYEPWLGPLVSALDG